MTPKIVYGFLAVALFAGCSSKQNDSAAPPAPAPVQPAPKDDTGASWIHVENFSPDLDIPEGMPAQFRFRASKDVKRVRVSVDRGDGQDTSLGDDGTFTFRARLFTTGMHELAASALRADGETVAESVFTVHVIPRAVPPTPPRVSRVFNGYVLKAVDYLDRNYGLLGYDRNAEFTHPLPYYSYGTLKPTKGGLTMCVAGVLEVILTAFDLYYQDTGDHSLYGFLPFASWDSLVGGTMKARLWVNPKLHSAGTADALAYFGMGEKLRFRDLQPGGFMNINRTKGTGHAVVFLGFIDAKGRDLPGYGPEVAGFRYFGAQGHRQKGEGGFGYRHAFFTKNGCPDVPFQRDCNVIFSDDSRVLNVGQLLAPSEWKHPKSFEQVNAEWNDDFVSVSAADFDGITTDD